MANYSTGTWPQYAASSQVEADDFQRVIRGVLLGKLISVLQGSPSANDIAAAKVVINDLGGWTRKVSALVAASGLAAKVADGTLAPADFSAGVTAQIWALVLQLAV
jgi:hypothetical protein